jgi:lipid A 3-O-deacylase
MNKKLAGAICCAILCLAGPARAVDGLSLELGQAHGVWQWRAGAQWNWQEPGVFSAGRWRARGYWDLAAGVWEGGVDTIYDVGLTPVFRFERDGRRSPYLEAAIGIHMLSSLHITPYRTFSSHLQFGDHIGAGLHFGPEDRYDIGLRLQHLSNGGLRNPNPGINFLQLRLQHHFN